MYIEINALMSDLEEAYFDNGAFQMVQHTIPAIVMHLSLGGKATMR